MSESNIADVLDDIPAFETVPLYDQVRKTMLDLVRTGRWPAGSPIPPEHELAAKFGVSAGTIRKALSRLMQERIVVRKHGKGTYICNPARWEDLSEDAKLVASILGVSKVQWTEDGAVLKSASGEEFTSERIKRLMLGAQELRAWIEQWQIFPDMRRACGGAGDCVDPRDLMPTIAPTAPSEMMMTA